MTKVIKIEDIKKLDIKKGEVLLIKESAINDDRVLTMISRELDCLIVLVEDFNNFMVISNKKLKQKNEHK
jgi:hypothetical protein